MIQPKLQPSRILCSVDLASRYNLFK